MDKTQQTILQQAEVAHEAQDFSKAIALYREALLLGPPTPFILTNLHFAEDFERLKFRRQLFVNYSTNPLCLIDKVLVQRSLGLHRDAYRTALSIDIATVEDIQLRYRITETRFQCALAVGATDHLLEDFLTLWNIEFPNQSKLRKRIVEEILRCLSFKILPFISAAYELVQFPENHKRTILLHSQILELIKAAH